MQRQPPQQETIDNIVELKLAVMRLNWFKRLFIARNLLQALGEFQVTDPKAAHAASQVQKVHHAYYRSTGLINWIGKIFLSCMIQFGQKIEQCHINREGTPVYSQTPPLTDPIEDRHITFDGSPLPNSPIRQTQSHDELTRLVYSPPSAAPEAELSYAQNHREMVLHRPTPRLLDPLRKPQPVLWPFFTGLQTHLCKSTPG